MFVSPEFGTKLQRELSTLILEVPFQRNPEKPMVACVKNDLDVLAVSIKYWLVTDRQTDRQRHRAIACGHANTALHR